METWADALILADWRRRVTALYRAARDAAPRDAPAASTRFRTERDELFRTHPASPLGPELRARFRGLGYYSYDPAWRMGASLDVKVPRETTTVNLGPEGVLRYTRIAELRFTCPDGPARLNLYWIEGYGGGLFLPFRDRTNGSDTFGGGRYLYDTIKGADLGFGEQSLVLDFNYAYNPSCAYDQRWVCPLAPAENALAVAVEAGEKTFG